jgi:hypothetical protein
MRIPSGRTKLCLAIDKLAFAWAMLAIDPMERARLLDQNQSGRKARHIGDAG